MTPTMTPVMATTGLSTQEAQETASSVRSQCRTGRAPSSAPAPPAQILVARPVDAGSHPPAGTGPRKVHPGIIIAILLVLNAVLSFVQERRASNALSLAASTPGHPGACAS